MFGNVQLTTQCIQECLKRGINVIFSSVNGAYFGRLISTNHVNVARQRLQADISRDSDFCLELSKRFINAKINNQIVVLRRYSRNRDIDVDEVLKQMKYMVSKADSSSSIDQLMGNEVYAAKNKMYTGQSFATKLWVADYSSAQTLGELADAGSGIRRLGVIRADVDNLGSAFVSGFPDEYQTLSRSASFSRMLSLFFKKNVNDILIDPQYFIDEVQEKRNATVIYAGGDDLFIIGAWKDIIEFSVDLRRKLEEFTADSLKISAGIGLYNEKYPVSYIASKSGDLESRSKSLEGKDAVTMFTAQGRTNSVEGSAQSEDHTYHWKEFTEEVLGQKLSLLDRFFGSSSEDQERGKAFLYRILELYRHSGDRINLARLAYLLARLEPSENASEEYRNIYDELKHRLYEWHKNPRDRKQFITAVYIYIYMIRDREEK